MLRVLCDADRRNLGGKKGTAPLLVTGWRFADRFFFPRSNRQQGQQAHCTGKQGVLAEKTETAIRSHADGARMGLAVSLPTARMSEYEHAKGGVSEKLVVCVVCVQSCAGQLREISRSTLSFFFTPPHSPRSSHSLHLCTSFLFPLSTFHFPLSTFHSALPFFDPWLCGTHSRRSFCCLPSLSSSPFYASLLSTDSLPILRRCQPFSGPLRSAVLPSLPVLFVALLEHRDQPKQETDSTALQTKTQWANSFLRSFSSGTVVSARYARLMKHTLCTLPWEGRSS